MSLNRWVFKWCLKVRMFSHSHMSEGREFQVDGADKKKHDGSVRCVCEERRPSGERRARGGAWVCTSSLRYVGVAVVRTL